jgi:branched-subunit amino acid aminotransferase/4-amino-4-deoxychorismate lyase
VKARITALIKKLSITEVDNGTVIGLIAFPSDKSINNYSLHACAVNIPFPESSVHNLISAIVVPYERRDAKAKDSQWIHERALLETLKNDKRVGEIIMTTMKGDALEGLVSNVYFITEGGEVKTASEGVLEGSVTSLVTKVCTALGIKVVHEGVNITDMRLCTGAFVTNAVRGATLLSSVSIINSELGTLEVCATYTYPPDSIPGRIYKMVNDLLLTPNEADMI